MQKNERARTIWENMKIQLTFNDSPKKINSYYQTIYENNSFKWDSVFSSSYFENNLKDSPIDFQYQKYLFTYFPSIYARFVSSKHPDTGLTFDTKCVHTTFPSTILHHSAAAVGLFSGISSFWMNWKRAETKFHTKTGKNQVFFSQKDFYQTANKMQMQASHKFGLKAFMKAFCFGSLVSIVCVDKFMGRYEIVEKAKGPGVSNSDKVYDPEVYHPENLIKCESKFHDFFIPALTIQTLLWWRRLGPLKSLTRSFLLSSIYTVPFQAMNCLELLPWQVERRVYIETLYRDNVKKRNENHKINQARFTRIIEELSTNRCLAQTIESEVYNTLIPKRNLVYINRGELDINHNSASSKFATDWFISCRDEYVDKIKPEDIGKLDALVKLVHQYKLGNSENSKHLVNESSEVQDSIDESIIAAETKK